MRDWPGWRWALLFRDWVTEVSAVRAEYLEVKRAVAAAHAHDADSSGYAEAKEPWMAQAYERGLSWAASTGWTPPEPR